MKKGGKVENDFHVDLFLFKSEKKLNLNRYGFNLNSAKFILNQGDLNLNLGWFNLNPVDLF